jgi:hypothetical protein
MDDSDYKRFLNFLRKHECQVSFKEYRKYGDDQERSRSDEPLPVQAVGGR